MTPCVYIITGGRDYQSASLRGEIMHTLSYHYPDQVIVHVGDCPTGVDALAIEVLKRMSQTTPRELLDWRVHGADWGQHGKAAGPIRNRAMVRAAIADAGHEKPTLLVGPGGRGTADCVRTFTRLCPTGRIITLDGAELPTGAAKQGRLL